MLIDAHAHLDGYDELGPGALEAALQEIEDRRIFTISNSMDVASYRRNKEIAARSDLVLPVFGVHPWNAPKFSWPDKDVAQAMEESPLYGEIGLDHYFVKEPERYPAQDRIFRHFLASARARGKAVIVHSKGAEAEVLAALDEIGLARVIIHWYSGPLDIFEEMASRGYYFTVGSEVLRSKHIQAIAREVRLDRLLTESDNPGGPKSLTGQPGRPSIIQTVVGSLAKLRGLSPDKLEGVLQRNLVRLLEDDPYLIANSAVGRLLDGVSD
jgi:TatD DNase family protein